MIDFVVMDVVLGFFIEVECECVVDLLFSDIFDVECEIFSLIIEGFLFDIGLCVEEGIFKFNFVSLLFIGVLIWVFFEDDFFFWLLDFFFICFCLWLSVWVFFGDGLNFFVKLLNSVLDCFFWEEVCFVLFLILLVFGNVFLNCGYVLFFVGFVELGLFVLCFECKFCLIVIECFLFVIIKIWLLII